MTEQEAYQEHIRYTHDTYCRIVIRHASFDAARMLVARWKREISLEYLTEKQQSFALAGVGHIGKLMGRDIELLCEDLPVSVGLIEHMDKFRHSPELENTRLWCLVGQTFLRSNIQGRFPVSTSLPAYGQRQRTHDE